MEEVKTYIETGILELYVLGQLASAESLAVEEMAYKHAEVKQEIAAIEKAMEAYAMANAILPSEGLGNKIFEKISIPAQQSKIIALAQKDNITKLKTLRFALVACVALLIISVAAFFTVYNQLNIAKDQIASLSVAKNNFASNVSKLEFNKAGLENRIAMTETSDWITVKLKGIKNTPKCNMLVYWNKINKNILINYAAMDLPKTAQNQQYQLWAMVNGKAVSLGVFNNTENAKTAVTQMETINAAQAFAVSIEPMGGSQQPTLEKMVVMGGV